MDAFVETLDGRIAALAGAHQLLSRSGWKAVEFADLVHKQLAPYATADRVTVSGPAIALTAEATESLSAIFHELVTNAAKYGALSVARGRVSVDWHLDWAENGHPNAGELAIEWLETDGPVVS